MRKNILAAVLLLYTTAYGLSKEEGSKNIGFNFFKKGVDSIEMVGNFAKDGRIVFLPMLPVSEKQWTLSLSLSPGYYYYRYRLDGEHWRLDPFNKDTIVVPEGAVQGKFTLLKVLPTEYDGYIDMSVRFIEKGQLQWASEALLKTAKTYPDKMGTYTLLGEVYEKLGYLGFAVDAYLAALERKEDHDIRYNLANVYETLYEEQKKDDYRKQARHQWLMLIDVGKYKNEAKEHLAQ